MNSFRKNIELMANIAIVIVAVLLCIVLIKNQSNSAPTLNTGNDHLPTKKESRVGEKISLRDVDWQRNGQTLLLALSTTCHYCSESAAFYQQISKERNSNTQIIAVLPQSPDEGKNYLERHGVSVDDIKQAKLDSIGVDGTPTLILVDNDGIVRNTWTGKLPKAEEVKVLNQLRQSIAQR
jgi:peroxiredoxin